MNDDITTAVKVLAAIGGVALSLWMGVLLVKAAKEGKPGARALGAGLLMAMSWAVMRDPRNDTVVETQDTRIRKGNKSGDPLDDEEPEA